MPLLNGGGRSFSAGVASVRPVCENAVPPLVAISRRAMMRGGCVYGVFVFLGFLLLLFVPARAAEEGAEAKEIRRHADDLVVLMEAFAEAGRWADAAAKGRDASRFYLAAGDARQAGRVLTRLGAVCIRGDRVAEGIRELKAALELQQRIGDPVGACLSLDLLAREAVKGPDPTEALPWLFEGFETVLAHDLRGAYVRLARTAERVRASFRSRKPAPGSYFDVVEREIDFHRNAGWPHSAERLMDERVYVLTRDERWDAAASRLREYVAFQESRGYRFGVAFGWHKLGLVLSQDEGLGAERFRKADEAYRMAQRLREEIGDEANLAWTLNNRGYLMLVQDRFDPARVLIERAIPLFKKYHARDGLETALANLSNLASEAGLGDLEREVQEEKKEAEGGEAPDPVPFMFSPKRESRAYYIFLRAGDREPVVRVEGRESSIGFVVLSTGEEFEVPVDPRPKTVRISFKAPSSFLSRETPPVAQCEFKLPGGRTVSYGPCFLFLEAGARALANREADGNFRLPGDRPGTGKEAGEEIAVGGSWTYPDASTPPNALRTAVAAMRRGRWEDFQRATSRFALSWIDRESFESTAEKLDVLPVEICLESGKRRNPAWVEIRYSYRVLWEEALEGIEGDPARRSRREALEARFAEAYGENRYVAFLVREGREWRLDFLDRE